MTTAARAIMVRGVRYPVVLPSLRDPRLHVAAVILTIHALGQVALGFQVSVPQILAAILSCAVVEVVLTLRQSRALVWPASAMLTGSGVALILRVVGTPPNDHWTLFAAPLFAVVATASLLTKYVIRRGGVHLFNPSNIGLVATFILLGSGRVEPLDFWWAPPDVWMLVAYAVIIVGGTLITRRLHLLGLASAFYVTLAACVAILAASGHCMTANWAFTPVCGADFWRTIVTSPEVLIFLFFMITDPRTVPLGGVGRIAFGAVVALLSTLIMAPQTDEFGTKVGLLAGLAVACAARPVVEHWLAARWSSLGEPRRVAQRLGPVGVGAMAVAVALAGAGIVVAGTPARSPALPDPAEILARVPLQIDVATLPVIQVDTAVTDWDPTLAGPGIQAVLVTLAQNLQAEDAALLRDDPSILTAVDHGDRLAQMQARLSAARSSGKTVIENYHFDRVSVSLLRPFGVQTGLSLGFASRGTVTEETYDVNGHLVSSASSPFALTFVVRRATGARWLNVAVQTG